MSIIEAAKEVLRQLNNSGFEAYFVGGFVRDFLLKKESYDIDITTSATPNDIKRIFKNVDLKGEKYNCINVIIDDFNFEVTTFRKDEAYDDYRHPIIKIANSLEEDLVRRDFTINALAMDYNMNIIDMHNGINDLNNKLVKAIGNPLVRFDEDALRILRGIYYSAKCEFRIESKTYEAILIKKNNLSYISKDRILEELIKMLNNDNYKASFKLLNETGVSDVLGIKDALNLIIKSNEKPSLLEFLALCEYYNNSFMLAYNVKKEYKKIINIALNIKDKINDNRTYYDYQADAIYLSSRLNFFLGLEYLSYYDIIEKCKKLPIKSFDEVNISINEIVSIVNKPKGDWISNIKIKIENAILNNIISNDYEQIVNYIKNNS